MSAVLDLLRSLVAIPSVSGDEGAVVARLADWLAARGLHPRVDDRNLEVRVGSGQGPFVLLNSHTDTVPVGEGWTRAPFDARVEDGRLYGRGANDAKASVAAMAVAVAELALWDLAGTVVFAATCEEERGRGGLGEFLPSLGPLDAAIFGEPTGLQPAVVQRGLLVLELLAQGRAGHAARPHLAHSAIEVAARDVALLSGMTWPERNPHLGHPTAVVTQIEAGRAHNVIPEHCRMVVDARTIPELPPEAMVERIRDAVKSRVTVRSDRFRPVATPLDSALWRAVQQTLPEAEPFGSPTLSDWAHLQGVPGVKLGPGNSEVSHTADEWVSVAQVERASSVYAGIAGALALGRPQPGR